MNNAPGILPNLEALLPHELKALIFAQHAQLLSKDEQLQSRDTEIEHLKLLLAKLRRAQFGRSSEKVNRQIVSNIPGKGRVSRGLPNGLAGTQIF
jgi:hypothetical protein